MKKLITLLLVLTGIVTTANAWNYLKGTFNKWTDEPAYCLDNGPVAVFLTAGSYEFGINANGSWMGPNGNADITETATITSFSGSGNFNLTVTTEGYYVFSLSWDPSKLIVRYPNTTVYFLNNLSWSKVYLHDGWWNGDNGASNQNALRGVEMKKVGSTNYYSAYIPKESLYRVTFTKDKQVNDGTGQYGAGYGNFYGTDVVWNAGAFDASKPLYVPAGESATLNECNYYYGGNWHAYQTYTREGLTVNKFGTICLPFAATVTSGATVFEITGKVEQNNAFAGINLREVSALAAGKPYIFKATSTKLEATLSGDFTEPTANNGLIGNIGSTTTVAQGMYVLNNNQVRKVTGDEVNVGQYKAYIDISAITEVAAPSMDFIPFEDAEYSTTGISNAVKDAEAVGAIYNLNGQRVTSAQKGLFIINGKKVIR